MSIETKRIYKIDENDFYGITQGTRPIVDDKGNITAQVQNPVATIRYENRLIVVEPYQVEFTKEQKECVGPNGETIVWHTDCAYGTDDIDTRYEIGSGYSESESERVKGRVLSSVNDYAMFLTNGKAGIEHTKLGKGYEELRIVWRED